MQTEESSPSKSPFQTRTASPDVNAEIRHTLDGHAILLVAAERPCLRMPHQDIPYNESKETRRGVLIETASQFVDCLKGRVLPVVARDPAGGIHFMAFDPMRDLVANCIVLGSGEATFPRLKVGSVRNAGNRLAVWNGYQHMLLAAKSGYICDFRLTLQGHRVFLPEIYDFERRRLRRANTR